MRLIHLFALFLVLLSTPLPASAEPPTATVQRIPLSGPVAQPHAELSGLAWHENRLVLLPQYPDRASVDGDPALYAITRDEITAYLDGEVDVPPAPEPISLDYAGVPARLDGFEGFEAIAFFGNRSLLMIEARAPDGTMRSFAVSGEVRRGGNALVLEPRTLRQIPQPGNLRNKGHEALAVGPDYALALFEANGSMVNPNPEALRLTSRGETIAVLPFPHVEYRVTGATSVDNDGTFYALNYYFPGDKADLGPATDPLPHGTNAEWNRPVERVLKLRVTEDGVERPEVVLAMNPEGAPRNWEGIARLPGRGFLVVTDRFPETILGFVPYDLP